MFEMPCLYEMIMREMEEVAAQPVTAETIGLWDTAIENVRRDQRIEDQETKDILIEHLQYYRSNAIEQQKLTDSLLNYESLEKVSGNKYSI